MRYDLVLRSLRTVTPGGERPAAVCVARGAIAAVEQHGERVDAVTEHDLGDLALLPGLVDTHVHINEPGRTEWEGFVTATRAAAAGGVTTLIDMPLNCLPPTLDAGALAVKRAAAHGKVHVDVGFWGGAVPGNLAELSALSDAGVFGFKAFLIDSGVPEFPPLDPAGLKAALATVEAPFLVHAEDPATVTPAPASRRYADFLASRPPVAEDRAIAAVIDAARATGARVHVLHLSSASALVALAAARAAGVRISAETCPHYLALAAEDVPDGATAYKCCPPIRGAANREALWRGLATGMIDCVVSDHSPCPPRLKRPDSGDFGAAWGGISSLQLGLAVVWTEARRRGFALRDVARWMADGPARLAGLPDRGRIEVGCAADLIALDPDATFTVTPERLHHRHPVTPYAGRVLSGVVRRGWLRGVPLDLEVPRGRLLSRAAA